MTAPLVEAIKQLRSQRSELEKITIQNVEWALDPSFIGEPMVPRVLKRLSQYVDQKLVDYSSILGSNPATNMPRATIEYDDPPFFPATDYADGDMLDENDFPTEEATRITREPNLQIRELRAHQRGLTFGNGFVPENEEQGTFIDNPSLLVETADLEPTDEIDPSEYDERGWPQIVSYIPEEAVKTEDDHIGSESVGVDRAPHNIYGPLNGVNIEEIEKIVASHGTEIEADLANSGEVLFQPAPIPGPTMGFDHHVDMNFSDIIETLRPEGQQVTGINPLNYTTRGDVHVAAHGALPSVRYRVRDSFIRQKHITLRIPQVRPNNEKEVSYVTSYTIEHQTMRVKARVITAPPTLQLKDDLWFELCDSDGGRPMDTLKDMVRNTIKANLCIMTSSRNSKWDNFSNKIQEPEKTALETLRDMISEQEFRNYLRYGFITVKGSSGFIYQIFRDKAHTKIWERGRVVEEVCVRINMTGVPPTDNVIAFKIMIETNEELFKSMGNVYNMRKK